MLAAFVSLLVYWIDGGLTFEPGSVSWYLLNNVNVPFGVSLNVVRWMSIYYTYGCDPGLGLALWVGTELISDEPFSLFYDVDLGFFRKYIWPRVMFVMDPPLEGAWGESNTQYAPRGKFVSSSPFLEFLQIRRR